MVANAHWLACRTGGNPFKFIYYPWTVRAPPDPTYNEDKALQRLSTLALSMALGLASLASMPAAAATKAAPPKASAAQHTASTAEEAARAATDRELLQNAVRSSTALYNVLAGELYLQHRDASRAYAYMMDAARRTADTRLYERAAQIAIQSRQPDAALLAVRAWQNLKPNDAEADNYQLQILLLLDRINESSVPLSNALAHSAADKKQKLLHAVPALYANVSSPQDALNVVQAALQPELAKPDLAFVTHMSLARMQLAAGQWQPAMASLEQTRHARPPAEKLGILLPNSELPALVALDLMRESRTEAPEVSRQAEALVQKTLQQPNSSQELEISYARVLIEWRRYEDSLRQLHTLLQQHPDYAMAWLLQGGVQLQTKQHSQAEASLQRYLQLRNKEDDIALQPGDEPSDRLLATIQTRINAGSDIQAYLMLAQLADLRNDPEAANAWLQRIPSPAARAPALLQRAETLKNQGKIDQAVQVVRSMPGSNVEERSVRALLEAQVLEGEADRQAHSEQLLTKALAEDPENADLLYTRGLVRERLNKPREAEADLRRVIALQPEAAAGYNALGYLLLERNDQLPEARTLIKKANALMPDSGAIQDSLGWAEYKLGNLAEARTWLLRAFASEPNAEIAAHLGEVHWKLGDTDKARAVWREGFKIDPTDKVLLQTMQRFGVQP